MLSTIIKRGAVLAGVAGLLGTLGAASASAATTTTPGYPGHGVTAVTRIINRYDGGGNGFWAYDTFTRTLTVTYLGQSTDPAMAATPYMYEAQVSDIGTFKDIPGAFTPNQGAPFTGLTLRPRQVSGPMEGRGQWGVFYASAKAHFGLVPTVLRGVTENAAYPSYDWPELAFPAGTTFSGVNEAAFDYEYSAVPFTRHVAVLKLVDGKPTWVIVTRTGYRQHWSDTSLNGGGQLPGDGNIRG